MPKQIGRWHRTAQKGVWELRIRGEVLARIVEDKTGCTWSLASGQSGVSMSLYAAQRAARKALRDA